jgi:CHAD domain-containing protein
MGWKADNLQKDVAQLRKSLKRLPKHAPPEGVHRLRSQIRSLEAIMDALARGREREVHHLLKPLILVRKAAGRVRDMDVLVELACSLSTAHDSDLVQLLEYLGGRRMKTALKLQHIIAAQREDTLRSLQRCSRFIEESLASSMKTSSTNQKSPANTLTIVLNLSTELVNWPRIHKDNLHSYRLKVKQLRYVLQLITDGDTKFVAALSKAKDMIGEWHDWNELAAITERVVDHDPRCEVRKQVQLITKQKLKRAISVANEIRRKYFRASTIPRNIRK